MSGLLPKSIGPDDSAAKETPMLAMPTTALVRDTFRRVVMETLDKCEETSPSYFANRCRSLANAAWVEIGPNVQAIQVTETEFLIRASWQFTIDLRRKDQLRIALAQINEAASILASVIPQGEPVKATFDFLPTETSASGEEVTCSFRGVACGQVQPC
jgi:hypothetical protein